MLIGVCVHPIDTATHATIPEGWRWAVHLGDDWGDMANCLNAGWQPTEQDAAMAGEAAAVCAVRVARLVSPGLEVRMEASVLAVDPIPADHDFISIGA